ncbi:MAG: imidazole glycerol phosphate synthase subunit HisH [Janthinobacterium lividum]
MSETVVVVDYGAGNLQSVANALGVAAGVGGGVAVEVSGDPAVIAGAGRVVLPGVGAFGQCIGALRARDGVEAALTEAVLGRGVPFLGICVGMQLLATVGHEHGIHRGLEWIDGSVERMTPGDAALKIPHMGWNTIARADAGHVALAKLPLAGSGYFVHSYHFAVDRPEQVLATTDYGQAVAAIVGRDNILGVQFHPEKSQAYGLAFLRGFLEWRP